MQYNTSWLLLSWLKSSVSIVDVQIKNKSLKAFNQNVDAERFDHALWI